MTLPHVHIITPIISVGFRDDSVIDEQVASVCRITGGFLDKGPASVESAVDEVLAAPGVVDAALTAAEAGAQALVIDCMLDPGLDATREAVDIPVIGAGEAGLHAAARFGRFAVVTVLDRQAHAFAALALRHGLRDALTGVHGIDMPVLALHAERAEAVARTVAACRAALKDHGAEAIVFGCTGMLGFASPVAEALGVDPARIVDPLPHAVTMAARAASAPNGTARLHPDRKPVKGFDAWPALYALIAPQDQT